MFLILFQIVSAQQKTYLINDVAVSPEFSGGATKLQSFIADNYEMPEDAKVFGQIELGFIVDSKGKLSNFEIVKDLGYGTGQEAIRVIKLSPRWKPGVLSDGSAVSVYFILPIKLQSK